MAGKAGNSMANKSIGELAEQDIFLAVVLFVQEFSCILSGLLH